MNNIEIFTDGSCNYKNKLGGCGVFINSNPPKFISKGFKNTTVGRMEIMALYYALRNLPQGLIHVTIYSDSQYVVNSVMEEWVVGWEKNNFKFAKNGDLWKNVLREIRKRPLMALSLMHVKGHQKDLNDPLVLGNTMADKLASYRNFSDSERVQDLDEEI